MNTYSNELRHYGVLGMKWGIRRYQNYDGTYTKKGLQRYNLALDKYEKAKKSRDTDKLIYKSAKRARRKGDDLYVKDGSGKTYRVKTDKNSLKNMRNDLKESKRNVKFAKANLKKHYRHLKQDKLADQGKLLYAQGRRITYDAQTAATVQSGIMIASNVISKTGNKKAATYLATAGTAINAGAAIYNAYNARRLRAFYGHTSNY